jgi:hypothetical protein
VGYLGILRNIQSLSEVVGTHLVSGSLQFFYTQYRSPPQSMLFKPKHIKPDEKWDTTLNRGRGGLSFVEIQRFCGICPKTFETDCIFALKKIEEHFQFSDNVMGES